jgi:hypothetical protein
MTDVTIVLSNPARVHVPCMIIMKVSLHETVMLYVSARFNHGSHTSTHIMLHIKQGVSPMNWGMSHGPHMHTLSSVANMRAHAKYTLGSSS